MNRPHEELCQWIEMSMKMRRMKNDGIPAEEILKSFTEKELSMFNSGRYREVKNLILELIHIYKKGEKP